MTCEERVLSLQSNWSDCALDGVAVHLDATVAKEQDQTPPCFAMFIPEFGEWIEPIVSPKASEARQSLRKMLLDLSEKGGKGSVLRKFAYADSANNIDDVHSPAVTIVGDSNPTTFFEAVSERNTGNGFFARFIILQSEDRVAPYNKDHARVEPSVRLLEDLGSLCAQSLNLNQAKTVQSVSIAESAQDELADFRNTCDEGRDLAEDEYKRAVFRWRTRSSILAPSALQRRCTPPLR